MYLCELSTRLGNKFVLIKVSLVQQLDNIKLRSRSLKTEMQR